MCIRDRADVARNMGQIVFIDLRDHEGIVQIVAEPSDAALSLIHI